MEQSDLKYRSNVNAGTRGTRSTNRSQTLGNSTGFISADEIPLQTRLGTRGSESFATSNDFKVKDDEGAVNMDVITMTRSDFDTHQNV